VEWVAEALRTGKLKIDPAKKSRSRSPTRTPATISATPASSDCAREIMSYIAEDFREMRPTRNIISAAVAAADSTASASTASSATRALKVKRDQILATGAKLVVAPCHNCWDAIRDMEEIFKSAFAGLFSKPLLLKMVIVPDHLKPED
jgi:virulence-associated protein VagC